MDAVGVIKWNGVLPQSPFIAIPLFAGIQWRNVQQCVNVNSAGNKLWKRKTALKPQGFKAGSDHIKFKWTPLPCPETRVGKIESKPITTDRELRRQIGVQVGIKGVAIHVRSPVINEMMLDRQRSKVKS